MPDYQMRVVLPYTTNLPRDVSVNDWTIHLDSAGSLASAVTALIAFYTTADWSGGSSHPFGYYASNLITAATNGCRVETYQITNPASPVLGAPGSITTFTLAGRAAGSVELPHEVALCTSFAANGTGAPGRRKGRIYLGPFNNQMSGPRPPTANRVAIAGATTALQSALLALNGNIAIWSRADGVVRGAARGWVDDAWDTQRRRGIVATTRTTWTNP
jgi:hypothetical protein